MFGSKNRLRSTYGVWSISLSVERRSLKMLVEINMILRFCWMFNF